MRNRPYRRIRNSAASLGLALALAVVGVAGCGGDGSSADESALRKELRAGAAKLADAKSFEASVLYETETEGETEEIGCIDVGIESRPPARFDMRFYNLNCSGGSEGSELVAVGDRAWASHGEGFSAARIAPKLRHQVDDEQTDFKRLFQAAEHIEVTPEGGAAMEPDGRAAPAAQYFFTAPASAFPDAPEGVDDKVEFEATIDHKGYLRELVIHAGEDDEGATVTQTYEDIGRRLGIGPPPKSEVHGRVTEIRTRRDLDELLGTPSP